MRTGLGPGLRHLIPKNRTGPDFQTLLVVHSISYFKRTSSSAHLFFCAQGLRSSEHDELQDSQYKVKYRNQHHGIHSRMVSGADPDVFPPVSQIQESRILEDPGMFGFRTAVLAFTSSFERSWNVPNVRSSAPSRTIASQAQLYTLE